MLASDTYSGPQSAAKASNKRVDNLTTHELSQSVGQSLHAAHLDFITVPLGVVRWIIPRPLDRQKECRARFDPALFRTLRRRRGARAAHFPSSRRPMLPSLLLLLASAPTTASRPLQPLRRRTNQPKDQSSLAIKAIHRLRGGSTSCTGSGDWRFFVAGSISAALSHGYTTPIDVIKTRMQTNPDLYDGSTILALRSIVAESGTPPPPPLPSHTRTHAPIASSHMHRPHPRQARSSYCRASRPRSSATAPRARSSLAPTRS